MAKLAPEFLSFRALTVPKPVRISLNPQHPMKTTCSILLVLTALALN
jgi:hypothetical protein